MTLVPNSTEEFIEHEGFNLRLITFNDLKIKALVTNGLSNFTMTVPENADQLPNAEIYFCLPSYWDLNDPSPNFQWPKTWLVKLWKHTVEKNTWLGHGHTIRCSAEYASISENMKQNHFFLVNPIYLKEHFGIDKTKDSGIQYFGIIPIFGEEMDFKQGKGTLALLKKLLQKSHSEKLDDFRESVLKGRLKMFR
ncbi:MAG: suppressor of fused domain protein [Bacteroidetes bacterium]|nr:suppressor of fused domain protein [Bacteroidota bacterium]